MRKEIIAIGIVMLMTASAIGLTFSAHGDSNPPGEETTIKTMEKDGHLPYSIGPEEKRQDTRATWYNNDWDYRRLISLTGDGTLYTNYTMRVDLNDTMGFPASSFANVNALGTDIRFTDSNSVTLQPQWKEYWNDTWEDATIWVNLDTIAAAGTTNYYMYYGNTAATTNIDDPDSVFIHFDTFSGPGYTYRQMAETVGPIDSTAIYKKTGTVRFQPDGDTYWYEENNSLMGISVGNMIQYLFTPTWDNYLAYGTLWNDSSNYSICGAFSDGTIDHFTRFVNNPIINVTYAGEDGGDSIKCTEPDWVTNITSDNRKIICDDDTYSYVIYYSGLNSTRWGICAANSTDSTNLDNTYTKQGVMLDASDVDWADEVRKPVVWQAGESDYRMLFAGYTTLLHWDIGYATSTTIMGPWTPVQFPVMNHTAYGWCEDSLIPTDVWGNATQTWMSFGAVDQNGYWRQGIANCSESDPLITWQMNRGHITYGESGMSDLDQGDCQYGSWLQINPGESGEYMTYYYTCTNTTHTSMSNANCYNTSWEHHGTSQSVYNLWDLDGDGNTGLYVDTNETYLLNTFGGDYEEGGADYHNLSISCEYWQRGSSQADNTSIIGRAGDAAFELRSHYATELNITGSQVNAICSLAGAESIVDNDTLADVFSSAGDQTQLNLWMMGGEIASYVENMPDNYTGYANGSDANHMNGEVGILCHNCPVEFDYFRVCNAGPSGGTTWAFGSESQPASVPGGGGGATSEDDIDYTQDTETPPNDDESTCCGSIGLMLGACFTATGVACWRSYANDPRRKNKEE